MQFKPSVIFFITDRCNLHCPFCFVEERRANANVAPEVFRRVIRNYNPVLLQMTGGEPTIHPRFDTLLRWALGRVPMVQFTTNGAGGPRHYGFLTEIKGRKPYVSISLDAPDERHDAIRRRPGLFREVVETTAMLRAARIPTAWSCTVFPPGACDALPEGNLDAARELIALSRRMSVPLNTQPAAGAPPALRRALGEILRDARSLLVTNSPKFIRMLLTGDTGPCRYGGLNVSIDTAGSPMPARPGDCYFAEDCKLCYYTCVWESSFLMSLTPANLPEFIAHLARMNRHGYGIFSKWPPGGEKK